MFLPDLIEFISADPSVMTLLTGGMYHPHLPEDFPIDKNWVVFEYSLMETMSVQGDKAAMSKYDLSIQTVSQDIIAVEAIADALKSYLIQYPNDWGIDAYLTEDSDPDFDARKKVYYKTLKYNILY